MSEADNHRHWTAAQTGVYEVWYTTWNHPRTDQGFWLRFITEVPRAGLGSPHLEHRRDGRERPRAELWFARFDPHDPARTFGIHKRFPPDRLGAATDPFKLTIAGCEVAHDHSFGELAGGGHDVRWDLRWDPAPTTLHQLPSVMYARGGLGETTVMSPNPRVPLSGTLLVDGEELTFERAIAGQTHLWGTKHAYAWTWGRCADFAGAPDGLLELLAVRLQRRGVTVPPMTLVSLDLDGERFRWNQFRHVSVNRATWRTGHVTFSAWSPVAKIEGELSCTVDQMVNAPYLDPDGTELFCVNTEIGDARLTVWKRSGLRWLEHRRLVGPRRAHFEMGSRERDPSVTRPHALVT